MRRVKSARVPLMGVRRSLSGTLIGSAIPLQLIGSALPGAVAFGFRSIELSWILEDNLPCAGFWSGSARVPTRPIGFTERGSL